MNAKQVKRDEINETCVELLKRREEIISSLLIQLEATERKLAEAEKTESFLRENQQSQALIINKQQIKLAEAEKLKTAAIETHDTFYTISLDADKTSPANARNMQDKIYKLKSTILDYEANKE